MISTAPGRPGLVLQECIRPRGRHRVNGHAVHAGGTPVCAHTGPRPPKNVHAVDMAQHAGGCRRCDPATGPYDPQGVPGGWLHSSSVREPGHGRITPPFRHRHKSGTRHIPLVDQYAVIWRPHRSAICRQAASSAWGRPARRSSTGWCRLSPARSLAHRLPARPVQQPRARVRPAVGRRGEDIPTVQRAVRLLQHAHHLRVAVHRALGQPGGGAHRAPPHPRSAR